MIAIILIILAIGSRLISHLDNAAAITAVGMLAGFLLPKKQAFAVPLAARLVTDIVIGLFAWQMMVAVYAAHLAGVVLGLWVKQSNGSAVRWVKIIGSGFAGAAVFFLVTNFAFLYPNYQHSVAGILLAYQNGLPFFRGTLLGDVGYAVGIFALYFAAVKVADMLRLKNIPSQA